MSSGTSFDELLGEEDFARELFEDGLEGVLEEDVPGAITESDLIKFSRCPYSYHLAKNVGLNKLGRSAFAAQVMFFENARKKLFKLRDRRIGLAPFPIRAGPNSNSQEEMSCDELQKYMGCSSAESFGSSLFGSWLAISGKNHYAGTPLIWSFVQQPHTGARELQAAGTNYYNFVLEYGAPIRGFVGKKKSFDLDGNTISIKLPEIRKGMFIDDPNIWGLKRDFVHKGVKATFDNNALVTLKILAYTSLLKSSNLYHWKFGVDHETVQGWRDKDTLVSGEVIYRHLNGTKGDLIVTSRTESNVDIVRSSINYFLEEIAKERFPENHTHCNSCPYNALDVDGAVACRKRKKGAKPLVPAHYLKRRNFSIEVDERGNKITLSGKVRKNEGIEKCIAKYELRLVNKPKEIQVNSSYGSEVRGLGFEQRMIREADRKLQELADRERKVVVHQINFEDNFKYAGQRRIEELLGNLRYFGVDMLGNYRKEYQPKGIEPGRPLQVGFAFESG